MIGVQILKTFVITVNMSSHHINQLEVIRTSFYLDKVPEKSQNLIKAL
jgi:hypothetical protein